MWPADLKRHWKTKHGQQKSKGKRCSPTDRGIYATAAADRGAYAATATAASEALGGNINVVLYAEFDNVIEIDRKRQVLFDYSA